MLVPALLLSLTAVELPDAVLADDLGTARKLIQQGANVKAANSYGVTPLSIACTNGNGPMVRLLLDAGADPNTVLPGGETVLMTASRTGDVAAVNALIERGAKVDAREPATGQTALMWAAAEGNVEAIQALLKAGADPTVRLESGFDALLFAVREGRIGAVRTLLKAGISPNDAIVLPEGKRPRNGRAPRAGLSALVLAVSNAHFELAAVLLDAGANPSSNDAGYIALHAVTWVRKSGVGDNDPPPDGSGNLTSIDIVKLLVAKGADINSRMTKKIGVGMTSLNTAGATPFLLAARTADAELLRLLASLGADTTIPNADGATPIIVAAGLGTRSPGEDAGTETEVVEALDVLIGLGTDVNAVDNNGETAMHGAAYKNYPAAVEFLASHGANPAVWNRKNKFGWTPLSIAEGYRFGNFKPSAVTVAALHKVMTAAGLSIASDPTARNRP
jgi:ankyrin repeat protein